MAKRYTERETISTAKIQETLTEITTAVDEAKTSLNIHDRKNALVSIKDIRHLAAYLEEMMS